jgi:hypothetical protein
LTWIRIFADSGKKEQYTTVKQYKFRSVYMEDHGVIRKVFGG